MRGAAVVELNGALGELLLGGEGVPSKVNVPVAEVAGELSARHVLHDEQFQRADEGHDLGDAGALDGGQRVEPVGDVGEFESGVVNVAGEAPPGLLDEVPEDGQHGDAAVLEFDVPQPLELGLVAVRDETQGIVKAQLLLFAKQTGKMGKKGEMGK